MSTKVTTTPKPAISGPVERESEDDIFDGHKWSRKETFALLDIIQIMLPQFSLLNVKKSSPLEKGKLAAKVKYQGIFNRSDADCSANWRYLRQRYLELTSPSQKKFSQRERQWPFMGKMNALFKNNHVITLEHVAEVVDGEVREAKVCTLLA
ncbi:hypothetical protein GHT06_020201 [Daphnia sinensis]|uniref:Myb/SANT-like DNA-binding domain-containing protein n=1 Tax=Daphnia sinensis TaxID=1820382 RepID=A0AAD5L2Q1_9CRUS|nr:hypothetical protein GHT06_020201 [Daphnia sinensis]